MWVHPPRKKEKEGADKKSEKKLVTRHSQLNERTHLFTPRGSAIP
jgi:hypothetical protein